MTSSSFGGISGFSRTGAIGSEWNSASKMLAEVPPRNGSTPVTIS